MNTIRLALGDLRHALRPVLLFALVWAIAQTVILSPLVTWALGYLLTREGQPAISNQDIAGFLMSPAGVLFLLLTAVSSAALQLGQLSGYQLLAQNAQRRAMGSYLYCLQLASPTVAPPFLVCIAPLLESKPPRPHAYHASTSCRTGFLADWCINCQQYGYDPIVFVAYSLSRLFDVMSELLTRVNRVEAKIASEPQPPKLMP